MSINELRSKNGNQDDELDIQFAINCAPLLSGHRISLFLVIPADRVEKSTKLIGAMGLVIKTLYQKNDKSGVLIYNERELIKYMQDKDVKALLFKLGYTLDNFYETLEEFSERYQTYADSEMMFPHELGIFLGYPIEDVIGYMENLGENYLCTGYWKVYKNASLKQEIFKKIERSQREMLTFLLRGIKFMDAVQMIQAENAMAF